MRFSGKNQLTIIINRASRLLKAVLSVLSRSIVNFSSGRTTDKRYVGTGAAVVAGCVATVVGDASAVAVCVGVVAAVVAGVVGALLEV